MRELDRVIEESCELLDVANPFQSAPNLLTKLVDQVCKAFGAIDLRYTSFIGWPP